MYEKPDCEACRRIHKKRGSEPPCNTCMPPLFSENWAAYQVFRECSLQYIYSFSGPVDVDLQSVQAVMDHMGIHDDTTFFQVVDLMRWNLKYQQTQSQAKK